MGHLSPSSSPYSSFSASVSLDDPCQFAKSVKRQVDENKDFQTNLKQLSEKGTEISESDAMKAAREAMTKSAAGTSKVVSAVAQGVGKGVETVLDSAPVKVTVKAASIVGETVQKAAEPIMETKTAKSIASGINSIQKDLSSPTFSTHYAEYKPKEIRDKERAIRMADDARDPNSRNRIVAPNAEATAVVITKPSKWQELMKNNPLAAQFGNLQRKIEESENPTVEWMREMWYRTTSVMEETEEARCVKAFKEVDPSFNRHKFLNDAATWIVPEVLEAHLKGDIETIRQWCSEKVTAELNASIELQRQSGLVSDCKLLDLRRVDIKKFVFLEEQIPVAILSFGTQEILLFRDRKTGEIKLGNEDHIDQAFYAIAMTKAQIVDPEATFNPATAGWKIIQWSRSGGF
ncbi:protein translocase subunit [Dinochytrium kinnereticum]|nr:protein translocase subunit [Dinochytrium kinnereticum]